MANLSPKIFERLTELKRWTPYIKSTLLVLSPKAKGKYELGFKESTFTTVMPMERANRLLNKCKSEGK